MMHGKAKELFLEYYWTNYIGKTRYSCQKPDTEDFFNSLYPILKTALIIEWLDEQEIFIKINPHIGGGAVAFYPTIVYRNEQFIDCFDDLEDEQGNLLYFGKRSEAIEIAIKSAIELYNDKNL